MGNGWDAIEPRNKNFGFNIDIHISIKFLWCIYIRFLVIMLPRHLLSPNFDTKHKIVIEHHVMRQTRQIWLGHVANGMEAVFLRGMCGGGGIVEDGWGEGIFLFVSM